MRVRLGRLAPDDDERAHVVLGPVGVRDQRVEDLRGDLAGGARARWVARRRDDVLQRGDLLLDVDPTPLDQFSIRAQGLDVVYD